MQLLLLSIVSLTVVSCPDPLSSHGSVYIVHVYREAWGTRGVNILNVIITQSNNQIRPSEIPWSTNYSVSTSPDSLLRIFLLFFLRELRVWVTSYPGLHPDFISQPWRKIDFSPRLRDCEIKSGWRPGYEVIGLGTRLGRGMRLVWQLCGHGFVRFQLLRSVAVLLCTSLHVHVAGLWLTFQLVQVSQWNYYGFRC